MKKYLLPILIIFLLVVFRLVSGQGLVGDQIHYLIMTQSLVEDGDFDLKEDYEQDRYFDYFDEEVEPHIRLDQFDENSRSWYSLHNPGLPILLAPFFYVFGYHGAILVAFFIGCLNLYFVYKWSCSVLEDSKAATFCVGLYGFSTLFLSLGGYIFPNLLLSTLGLLAMLITFKKDKGWRDYLLLSLVLGVGVWVHVKMLLVFALVGFYNLGELILKYRGQNFDTSFKSSFIALTFPVGILLLLFEWKLYQWYGVFLPTSTFASGQMFELYPWFSLSAVLFDFAQGVLVNNPSFLLMLVGMPIWYKLDRDRLCKLAFFVLPGWLLQLTFGDWWGGWSPSGRYLIEVLPFFVPAAGFVYIYVSKYKLKYVRSLYLFWLIQLIFAFIYLKFRSDWILPGDQNVNEFLSFLPMFDQASMMNFETAWIVLLLLMSICLSMFYIGWWFSNDLKLNNEG